MGLVVNYVDDNGPSKGLIQQHDVLQKLDDQWLANAEQLVALVRMHKPGDAVQVSLVRESKPMTVALKLAEKDVASSSSSPATNPSSSAAQAYDTFLYGTALRAGDLFHPYNSVSPATQPGQFSVAYVFQDGAVVNAAAAPTTTAATMSAPSTQPTVAALASGELVRLAGARWLADAAVVARTRAGPVTIDDGQMLMWLQPGRDGAAELTVVERASGKVTFRGPIGTSEQWEKVPQDVREKFDAWKSALEQTGQNKPANEK
jgi:hypothetical protein